MFSRIRISRNYGCWLLVLYIFLLAVFLQSNSLMSGDSSWVMHAAERFMRGDKYVSGVFESNPPLIFYLHVPAVLLAHFFKLNFVFVIRLYTFAIAWGSLLLCHNLSQKIFAREHIYLRISFLLAIAFAFFLLPGLYFSEREHLTAMLVAPYLLLAALRASNKSVSVKMAAVIGVLAGVGFALKPFFLTTPVLVELYLMIKRRNFFAWCRVESLVILLVLVSYLEIILVFTPEYLPKMVPYASFLYVPYYFDTQMWRTVYFDSLPISCALSVFLWLLVGRLRDAKYSELKTVIALGVVGFFLSNSLQLTYFAYHTIPMMTFSILLTLLVLYEYFAAKIVALSRREPVVTNQFLFVLIAGAFVVWAQLNAFYHWTKNGIEIFYDSGYQQLVDYVHAHANHEPVYVFSTGIYVAYPLVDYADVQLDSRFGSLWVMPTLFLESSKRNLFRNNWFPVAERKKFVIDAVTTELIQHPPRLVLILPIITWNFSEVRNFDYPQFFSANPAFKSFWQHYHYAKSFGYVEVYERS